MTGRVRGRWLRALAAAGAAGVVAAGTAACEPTGYSNTSAIAVTTDRQGTRALEWEKVDVRWLSCTASAPNGGAPEPRGTADTGPDTSGGLTRVDCQGQTASGERITIRGLVTREVSGRCVEGSGLVARVGNRVIFRTNTIGNCNAPASDASSSPANPDNSGGGGSDDDDGGNSDDSGNSGGGSDDGNGGNGDRHDDGKWQDDGKWHDGNHDDCPDGDKNDAHGDHGDDGHDDGKWQDDGKWHDGKDAHGDGNGDAHDDRAARQ
ncbi:hypothetical protein ABT381_07990 [Streptomyces sp. NPDC000151]|uniref:hypothetical protein n=1 Tax=Streptomyces sp. NPDC000151 TaxID=3154244 RepID=UPI0033244C4D